MQVKEILRVKGNRLITAEPGGRAVDAVKTMAEIVARAEISPYDDVSLELDEPADALRSMAYAISIFAQGHHIDGILALSVDVPHAENLLLGHPEVPLYLGVSNVSVARQANLRWGVVPFVLKFNSPPFQTSINSVCPELVEGQGGPPERPNVFGRAGVRGGSDQMPRRVLNHLVKHKLVKKGARILLVHSPHHKPSFELIRV